MRTGAINWDGFRKRIIVFLHRIIWWLVTRRKVRRRVIMRDKSSVDIDFTQIFQRNFLFQFHLTIINDDEGLSIHAISTRILGWHRANHPFQSRHFLANKDRNSLSFPYELDQMTIFSGKTFLARLNLSCLLCQPFPSFRSFRFCQCVHCGCHWPVPLGQSLLVSPLSNNRESKGKSTDKGRTASSLAGNRIQEYHNRPRQVTWDKLHNSKKRKVRMIIPVCPT